MTDLDYAIEAGKWRAVATMEAANADRLAVAVDAAVDWIEDEKLNAECLDALEQHREWRSRPREGA